METSKTKTRPKKRRPKVIAVIQARIGSTRLPRKVLKKIFEKTMIEWIAYRLGFSRELDGLLLSTADSAENDPVAEHAREIGLPFFRGSEADLISRLLGTARAFKADAIVRITADCPLVDPEVVDTLVRLYREGSGRLEYVSNVAPPTFPHGLEAEVIPTKTLERLDREVTDPLYREWLTTTILEHPERFRVRFLNAPENHSEVRLTVDYEEDAAFVTAILKNLHRNGTVFTHKDILELLKKQPELLHINENRLDRSPVQNNFRNDSFYKLKQKRNNAKE